ncbi:hypothetical protein GOFOIKOB_3434 [Methylobacterium tardum]|jgi:hypothetical protein|uniref:Uncharacterized protein n=1 Tax=Methylobacterium tardum TaxID=374432 RepID=A0AA37TNY6_9HYPH|nr:hypothetical protein [Methylobacterium tardum]URD34899.1 hypothetical protein M6G65_20325 [Methylobacterium tardum]GJE50387.1 hypothetical protein GOFOIKOB_3434 [Methylobacterium tardum]GLS71808.1 hypothetical protein GCM10007890_38210 [Methylobacterium tardum]
MQRLPIIVLATLALGGTAFAAEQGASSRTPGHEMQDRGSKAGSPGASGYAPGHEMKSGTSDSTGSTSRTGGSATGTSGTSGTSGTGTHR